MRKEVADQTRNSDKRELGKNKSPSGKRVARKRKPLSRTADFRTNDRERGENAKKKKK